MLTFATAKAESTSATGAEIAQVVERFTRNEKVAGSSPAFGSENQMVTKVTIFFLYPKIGVKRVVCVAICVTIFNGTAHSKITLHNTVKQ